MTTPPPNPTARIQELEEKYIKSADQLAKYMDWVDHLKLSRKRLREALELVLEKPLEFNEWGEAEAFQKCQEVAREALDLDAREMGK